jgi:hypothetical protein
MCVLLAVTVMISIRQPRLITVIDSSTGKTFTGVGKPEIKIDIIPRQLIYYSRLFCEAFLSENYVTVMSDRAKAKALMHPSLSKKLPPDFLNESSMEDAFKYKSNSLFEWIVKPVVTASDDPRYTVFCQFVKKVKREGYKTTEDNFNVKLDWGRLMNNQDPFNRPHDLVLLKFDELKDNSAELKSQLNLIK